MTLKSMRSFLLALVLALGGGVFAPAPLFVAQAAAPSLLISQIPLTVAIPTHPQVLFAIGNSQSMDGDLSGAIMTGSGAGAAVSSLLNSSSPLCYVVPAGFTPPLLASAAGCPAGSTAYTVDGSNRIGSSVSGTLYDNAASRLNVAKAGIQAIISAYAKNTQFALETYSTGGPSLYTTWVYQMSNPGGFTFTNTVPSPGTPYVANPCYQYTGASATVKSNCTAIAPLYPAGVLNTNQYMLVQNSSDDASVNDVLYWTGGTAAFVDYGARSKPNPYPPNFSLANYNNGNITIGYASVLPGSGIAVTGPTNAGFVPYSDQVFYAQRGFGYYTTSLNANTGNVVVPMQSAGANPTPASVAALIAAFTPSLQPETNNSGTSEIKALAAQSPLAGLMTKAKSYMAGVPNPGGCAKQYVILISDGLPTEDLNGKAWPPLGSAAALGYGVTATFNADGTLNTTNDQALTDTINAISALNAAGIKVYVVGMGAGVDPTANPTAAATLTAMAMAGGTKDYFPATSPADLVTNLNTILVSIQNGSLSSSSVATNSGSLNSNSAVYQASFTVSDSPYQDWTGDLLAYGINPATGAIITPATWSAKANLTSQFAGTNWDSARLVATWNPAAGSGVPFRWANISAAQKSSLTLGTDPAVVPPALSSAQLRLNYLRGDVSKEQRNGGTFRNRSFLLGDIVDSNPAYVGQPVGPYLDASFLAFERAYATPATARTPMLYVGSNDGMLHAINASTGNEAFAFVPNAVFANLINLTSTFYNSNHQFFVDGAPNVGDALFGTGGANATWHTILVGGENAGGNSIYALDVTNPKNIKTESDVANSVLWEFTDPGSTTIPGMGQSFSAPIIARINANPVIDAASGNTAQGFAVLFGNGYNSLAQTPVFYAVKAGTGAVIAKINLCTAVVPNPCNAALPNGLSSVVAANSSGVLGFPVDEVYAGDLQGNLWAIDIGDPLPAKWKVRLVFQARDGSGNPQPITTAPVVTLNPNYPTKLGLMVFFGTGQLLQNADLTNTSQQSFYGVWDNKSGVPATRGKLQQQTLTQTTITNSSGATQAVRTSSNNSVDWSTQQGWYEDLPLSGERVISAAVVRNGGIVFDTYTPNSGGAATCAVGGVSWLMDVAYENGGPFDKPELDVFGNGNLNSPQQKAGGQNPVGMQLGNSYVPTPTIMHAAGLGGGVGDIKVISTVDAAGNPVPKTVKERGHGPTRAGWWQIK